MRIVSNVSLLHVFSPSRIRRCRRSWQMSTPPSCTLPLPLPPLLLPHLLFSCKRINRKLIPIWERFVPFVPVLHELPVGAGVCLVRPTPVHARLQVRPGVLAKLAELGLNDERRTREEGGAVAPGGQDVAVGQGRGDGDDYEKPHFRFPQMFRRFGN